MTRVALLGFGTVESAVARRLIAARSAAHTGSPGYIDNIALSHILDRRAGEKDDKQRALAACAPVLQTSHVCTFELAEAV